MATASNCSEGDTGVEVIVGTYETFLLGYKLMLEVSEEERKFSLKQSFTNNTHCQSVRSITSVGRYVASGSTDEVILLINLVTRTEHGFLQEQNGTITCLKNYGSEYLFSGSEDGTICIFKSGSWQCEKTLHAHPDGVTGLSVHPTGKLALSVGKDKALKTWNLVKGRSGYTTNLKELSEYIQWSLDGTYYALSISNRVDVYALETAKIVYTIPFGNRVSRIVFLDDENVAIAGDSDTVEIHNIKSCAKSSCFFAHRTRVKDINYLPDRKLLVTVSNDGLIKVWNFEQDPCFSNAPILLTEVDTTCRITCATVWDSHSVVGKAEPMEAEVSDTDEEIPVDENEDDEEEEEVKVKKPKDKKKKHKKDKKPTVGTSEASSSSTSRSEHLPPKAKRTRKSD